MLAKTHSKAAQKSHTSKNSQSLHKKSNPSSGSLSKLPKCQNKPREQSHIQSLKSTTKITKQMLMRLKQEIDDMRQQVSKIKNQCSICSDAKPGSDGSQTTTLQEISIRDWKGVIVSPGRGTDGWENEPKIKITEEYLFCSGGQNKQNQSFLVNYSEVRRRRTEQADFYVDYYLQH